ncbi:9607_t:CDS:2 [Diversispora eburnea]|uniref:9607_t:CDS:1 n=1 Tax=Diversispora eburnea TaxID=1213867 RepID=A0A9N8WAA0_9GLOM|nr:9607_t:CDS:2 [Diversispora eburnea]
MASEKASINPSTSESNVFRNLNHSPTCPIFPGNINIIREEFAHASEDQNPGKKASQIITDTIDGDEDLEFMREIGLNKKSGPNKAVCERPITNKNTDTQERGTSPIVINNDDFEQTPVKDNDERDIYKSLLEELFTPIKGETVEAIIDEEENSPPKNLYQKACCAEMRATKENQEEIICWYYYEKGFEERVEDILKNERMLEIKSRGIGFIMK